MRKLSIIITICFLVSSVTNAQLNYSPQKYNIEKDKVLNTVIANGQTIDIPEGNFSKIYFLAAGKEDTQGEFTIDGKKVNLSIQSWTGYIGQFYNRKLNVYDRSLMSIDNAYVKPDNIAWFASHRHNAYPSANEAYQYSYMFKYEIKLPAGAKKIVLPVNDKIMIFAVALLKDEVEDINMATSLYDNFQNNSLLELR